MAAGCHLQRQFTNASTNTKKYTISFWVQRSNHGVEHALITANNSVDDGASGRDFIRFESDDHLRISINDENSMASFLDSVSDFDQELFTDIPKF